MKARPKSLAEALGRVPVPEDDSPDSAIARGLIEDPDFLTLGEDLKAALRHGAGSRLEAPSQCLAPVL